MTSETGSDQIPAAVEAAVADQTKFYKQLLPLLMAIPDKEVIAMNMPPHEATAEAVKVQEVLARDHLRLLAKGLKKEFVDSLPARVGAFLHSVAQLDTFTDVSLDAMQQWRKLKPVAQELREELIAGMLWALRDVEDGLKAIDNIKKGKGNKDMNGDLLSLNLLGEKYKELMSSHGISRDLIEQAAQMNLKLGRILAHTTIDTDKYDEANDICNRAWTHLWQALKDIYACGRYVFRTDPEKYNQYFMDYFQEMGKMGGRPAKTDDSPESSTTDSESADSVNA